MVQRCRSILFLLLLSPALLSAQDDLRDLVRRVKPGVVTLAVFDSTGGVIGMGSGFFVAPDRIVTNRHVVERASRAEYRMASGEIAMVEGVAADNPATDLVKLVVRPPLGEATTLQLSDVPPEEGERIVAIGSPRGLELTVSEGIVSSLRSDPMIGTLLQITAPISPGSSGGPILNRRGEVVGVASWVMAEGQNLNFAVPVARVAELKEGPTRSFDEWRRTSHATFDPLSAPPLPPEFAEDPQKAAFLADYALMRGRAFYGRGDWEQAIEMTTTAAMLNPSLVDAWKINATAEMRLGHHEHAEYPLMQAIRLEPKNLALRVQLGDTYYYRKMPAEAIGRYEAALAIDSTYGIAWNGLGRTIFEEYPARRDEAAQYLLRALRYDSTIAEAWYVIGRYHVIGKRSADAVDAFERSLALQPDVPPAVLGLADGLGALGRFSEASDVLRAYLANHPADAEAHLRLGMVMNGAGRYADALSPIRRSLELRGDHAPSHYALGVALAGSGKQEDGFRSLIEAIRHDPDYAPAHHALGLSYLTYRKDRAAALEEYRILKDLDPVMAKDLFEAIYR